MKYSFKYISSFFIILSFLVLGEVNVRTTSNVKNINESEWVTKTYRNGKISRCYRYNPHNVLITDHSLHTWTNEINNIFNHKVIVILLLQAKIFNDIIPINLIFNKFPIQKDSFEYHHSSSKWTDLILQFCLSSKNGLDLRNIMWNQVLRRKCSNHQIKYSVFSMDPDV